MNTHFPKLEQKGKMVLFFLIPQPNSQRKLVQLWLSTLKLPTMKQVREEIPR